MPFRQTTHVSTRIRRTKSSASVRTHHASSSRSDSIDPEVARQQAVAAAAVAFERASQHDGVHNLSRRHSTCGYEEEHRSGLSRQRSVRFVGPNAMPRRQLTKHREDGRLARHGPGAGPRQSMGSSMNDEPDAPGGALSSMAALEQAMFHTDVSYTAQDDVASAPSSYRRLRKTKSLSIQAKRFSGLHTNVASNEGTNAASADEKGSRWKLPDLRASKSISVMSFTPDRMTTISTDPNPAAVAMARQEYMHQFSDSSPKRQPSFLLGPSARRNQKALRKTVRTGAETRYGAAIASPNQIARPAKKGFTSRARGISVAIKSKLKRVFQRSSDRAETIPVQQLDASRPHWGGYDSSPYFSHQESEPVSPFNEQALVRGPARAPSLRVASPSMNLQSRAGSIHSAVSANESDNDKSRVTSWTNSTAVNTIAAAHPADFKPLTSIQEHCDDPESPLYSGTRLPGGIRYAAFRGPMEASHAAAAGPDQIDTRRVYSALIKKLDENSPGERQIKDAPAEEGGQMKSSWRETTIPLRSTSMESQSTDATVMHLPAGKDVFPVPHEEKAVLGERLEHAFGFGLQPDLLPAFRSARGHQRDSQGALVQGAIKESNNVLVNHVSALPQSRLPRFPGAIENIIATPTPRSRQLSKAVGSDKTSDEDTSSMRIATSSEHANGARAAPEQGSESDSNSVYSRTTTDIKSELAQQHIPPSKSEIRKNGVATCLDDPNRPESDDSQGSRYNDVHQSQSASRRENTPSDAQGASPIPIMHKRVRPRESLSPQRMGHRRENAQIDETDVMIGSSKTPPRQIPGLHEIVKAWRSERGSPLAQISPLRELNSSTSNIIDLYQHRQLSAKQSAEGIGSSPSVAGVENERPVSADRTGSLGATPETAISRSPVKAIHGVSGGPHRSLDTFACEDVFQDHNGGLRDATNKLSTNRTATPVPARYTWGKPKRLTTERLKRFSDYDIAGRAHSRLTYIPGHENCSKHPSKADQAEEIGIASFPGNGRQAPHGLTHRHLSEAQESENSGDAAFL